VWTALATTEVVTLTWPSAPTLALTFRVNMVTGAMFPLQHDATVRKHCCCQLICGSLKPTDNERDDKAPDRWMVKLTFFVVLVSAAQLWMFYRQWAVMREGLGDTQKAAEAAGKAADAAAKSADSAVAAEMPVARSVDSLPVHHEAEAYARGDYVSCRPGSVLIWALMPNST
jgi:hypothetical protein